ncbi:hypothetical protein QVD17_15666 [Tagetes erecta]|uniref:C2H2-type domain-containing protein n=1 Tax=Tagetes erecta TaxID=13708 RepID=A0AAD8KQJ4_TARER|nr:hypothetical protein QVD17_15666 [Tagetes erecta]
MDQSRSYWIQKDQPCLHSHVVSSFGDSWEEQAFAEDATGPLGGCIWPPRSYTCTFCRREFRSAQALGGHMNVHRRDRARLKKIEGSNNNQVLESHTTSFDICVLQYPNKIQPTAPSCKNLSYTVGSEKDEKMTYLAPKVTLGLENPNKICNPNLELDNHLYSSSSQKPSRVSILHPFTCSFSQEHQKGAPLLTSSKFESQNGFRIADLGNHDKVSTHVLESNSTTLKKNDQQIEVHLANDHLNSLVRRRCNSDQTPIFSQQDDAHNGMIFKRRRIEVGVRSFFPKSSSLLDGEEVEPVVPLERRSTNSTLENLDLELRLGDRP